MTIRELIQKLENVALLTGKGEEVELHLTKGNRISIQTDDGDTPNWELKNVEIIDNEVVITITD